MFGKDPYTQCPFCMAPGRIAISRMVRGVFYKVEGALVLEDEARGHWDANFFRMNDGYGRDDDLDGGYELRETGSIEGYLQPFNDDFAYEYAGVFKPFIVDWANARAPQDVRRIEFQSGAVIQSRGGHRTATKHFQFQAVGKPFNSHASTEAHQVPITTRVRSLTVGSPGLFGRGRVQADSISLIGKKPIRPYSCIGLGVTWVLKRVAKLALLHGRLGDDSVGKRDLTTIYLFSTASSLLCKRWSCCTGIA